MSNKLLAKVRSPKGGTLDLEVLDISAGGCMVNRRHWSLEPGKRVLVTLPGLSAQPGELVWVEDDLAGIAFEQVLHEAVLGHLQQSVAAAGK